MCKEPGLIHEREKKRSRRGTSHTTRNIIILGLVIIAIVIVAVLLSAPNPQFFMTIHVYDAPVEYTLLEQLPNSALVQNVTITIAGPGNFGPDTTPTGIFAISTQIPRGTYMITAEKPGYNPGAIQYAVDNNCTNKQILLDGNIVCHVLLRVSKPS